MKLVQNHKRRGQGMVEYMLIIGLVALMVFVAIKTFGGKIKAGFSSAGEAVTEATTNWKGQ